MTAEVEPAQLLARATSAVAEHLPGAALTALEPLPGGISSLTFAAWLDAAGQPPRKVVVKVAPPGLAPVRNRDVLRQAKVLRALRAVPGVRVPHVLATQDGSPPMFVMEFVEGEAYEPVWDVAAGPPSPVSVQRRVTAAATMLAHLHVPAPEALGLDDEPALALPAELERWGALYATAGDELRGEERGLYEALAARFPTPAAPRLAHGDYRLGNLLFAGEAAATIIDWELWSLGDPRTDLAWLMMFCDPVIERAVDRDAANTAAGAAMSAAAPAVRAAYESVRPGEVEDLVWFQAYAHYKLAAAMAALAKRNRWAADPDPTLERAAHTLAPAITRGLELIGAWGQ